MRQMAMMRNGRLASGKDVVEKHTGTDVGALVVFAQREEERCRPHEVRRDGFDEHPALAQRLAHEGEIELLEIPEPAMDQLRGSARGSGGEVAFLDEAYTQPTRRGIESDPGPGDTAADHHEVEGLGLCSL